MAFKHQVTNYLQTDHLLSTSFLALSFLKKNLLTTAVNSIDGQEQGTHTKEEEN